MGLKLPLDFGVQTRLEDNCCIVGTFDTKQKRKMYLEMFSVPLRDMFFGILDISPGRVHEALTKRSSLLTHTDQARVCVTLLS